MSKYVPDHIREAGEKAEKMMLELQKKNTLQPTEEVESIEPDTQGEREVQPEVQPEVQSEEAQVAPEPEFKDVQTQEVAPVEKERNDYKAKFLTLQGKYDAEVPRLHTENNRVQQRVADLERMLAEQFKAKQEPAKEETVEDYSISAEERDSFGEDLLDVVRRQAAQVFKEKEQRYLGRIEELEQRLSETGEMAKTTHQKTTKYEEDSFFNNLLSRVPDFEQVNTDPQFISWLSGVDPYTGKRKHDLLLEAGQSHDVGRAAAFFDAYKQETGKVTEKKAPNQKLEQQIAPNKGASAQPVGSAKKTRVFSRNDVAKFYTDVVAGKYKGREKEQAQLEQEIILAGREGRVQ